MNTAKETSPAQEPQTVFILTYREETCVMPALCFSSRDTAQETMERRFKNALSGYDPNDYDLSETYCEADEAVIALYGGWPQWNIWEAVVDAQPEEASQ